MNIKPDRDADTERGLPDGGRRLRTPEFYWGRAKALRKLAADNRGLALNYRWIAKGCDDKANDAERQADLMDAWANQAEVERRIDGSGAGE